MKIIRFYMTFHIFFLHIITMLNSVLGKSWVQMYGQKIIHPTQCT